MLSNEEKRLLKGCSKGDSLAQKQLYELFSNDMYKVCLMYSNDDEMASDLLQEGFLKVFRKIHEYKNIGSLGGWIRKIMINTCIDFYRVDKWSKYFDSFDDAVNPDHATLESDSNESLDESDFLNITRGLPDGYRLILNLYYLEDYTHPEIAEELGINIGTSKSQLHKAKKYLKSRLLKTLSQNEIEEYGGFTKKVV